jgi:hypothetical protein
MSDTGPIAESASLVERYERLRRYVGLDLLDIEGMFMQTPRLVEDAAELAARADQAENIAKHNYDLAVAEASDRIRQPWVVQNTAQGRIDSELKIMVPMCPDVVEARRTHTNSIYFAKACEGLFTTLKEQSRLLGKAADMVNSGYIKPSTLLARSRAAGRQAYEQRETIQRPRE